MRSRDEILVGIGTPLCAVFGQMTDDPAVVEKWIATYREYNLAHHDQRVRAYDGAVDMVMRIKAAGFRLGAETGFSGGGAPILLETETPHPGHLRGRG